MSRKEKKKGHGGKHTRSKKWSGARRPAGLATTALGSGSGALCEISISHSTNGEQEREQFWLPEKDQNSSVNISIMYGCTRCFRCTR